MASTVCRSLEAAEAWEEIFWILTLIGWISSVNGTLKYNPSLNTLPVTAWNLVCTPRYPAGIVPTDVISSKKPKVAAIIRCALSFICMN